MASNLHLQPFPGKIQTMSKQKKNESERKRKYIYNEKSNENSFMRFIDL